MRLPQEASAFLDVPRDHLKRVVSIVTQVALVRHSSSSLLYMMMGVHLANLIGRKLLESAHDWFVRHATRSVLLPSESDLTWQFALMPQNVGLYQSFARDEHEALKFAQYLESISGY